MEKHVFLLFISTLIVLGIYSLNQPAYAFLDATLGSEDTLDDDGVETPSIESDCFNKIDDDIDGTIDFEDTDC